ncbi:hypothetical protein Q8W37_19080 [Shimia thalassica]|nr:hypothetical protein [Shimia thalassica]MDP2520573.1 hypothetical protein [Shimia thalassica]MDP2582051.1 hypothetical protein [Shimia thalassica]
MYTRSAILIGTILVLGACSTNMSGSQDGSIPSGVIEIADTSQDLTTARLRSEDNCYWYMHSSPVETTLLPLRTVNGNPICAKASS